MLTEKTRKKLEKHLDKKIEDTPDIYYQPVGLKEALLDDKAYLHMNISNRRDGKSFTTTDIFNDVMLKFKAKVLFLARDERSRVSYYNQMVKVIKETGNYKEEFLEYRNIQRWYINIYYQSEHIASIIDYSEIDSLKNESAFLSQFSIIFMDEFIVQPYRYLRNEYTLLKVLYKSVNRNNPERLFQLPKMFFAGNATNFDSPILSGFDLLNIVETQELNTHETYNRNSVNIIIEKHKNENANVDEESDMFPDENEDANSLGDFVFNNYNIEKNSPLMEQLVIDMNEFYLYVYYTHNSSKLLFEIKGTASSYDFCISKNSEDEYVTYLDKLFYQNPFKFDKIPARYVNSYSKSFITSDNLIKSMKFYKIISIHKKKKASKPISDEKYNNDILLSRAKLFLSSQYNLENY